MKRVIVDRYGGPEVLRVLDDEDPRPAAGEVRVRLLAAGSLFATTWANSARRRDEPTYVATRLPKSSRNAEFERTMSLALPCVAQSP